MSSHAPGSARVLIVDDEPGICAALKRYLGGEGHETHVAASGEEALKLLLTIEPDVALVDFRLPGVDGLTLLNRFRAIQPGMTVVLMTAFGGVDTAIRATQDGAFAYLPKPLDLVEVGRLVERAVTSAPIAVATADGAPGAHAEWALLGRSDEIQRVGRSVAECGAGRSPVLFVGEIGSGREAAARSMLRLSSPRTAPVVHHCANLQNDELENAFRETGGAPHLLLELDELEPRARESVVGLAANRAGRILAATMHHRPHEETESDPTEQFIEAGWSEIRLPTLRERIADLAQLLPALLAMVDRELGRNVRGIDAEALAILEKHRWPGNLSELQNVVRSAVLASRQDVVVADSLPAAIRSESGSSEGVESTGSPARKR